MIKITNNKIYLATLLAFVLSSSTKAAHFYSDGQCRLKTTTDLVCDGRVTEVSPEEYSDFKKMIRELSSCVVEDIKNAGHNTSSLIRNNEFVTYNCAHGHHPEGITTRKCTMGRLIPSFALYPFSCAINKPKYYFPNIKLSWLASQKYCQTKYGGNLANHGLETQAARRALAIRFNTKDDFSVGFRRVNGVWLRVDGSVIYPPLDNIWYPEHGYPVSTPGYDYMRLRGYQQPHNERLGMLWNHLEHHKRLFICEKFQ